MPEGSTTHFGGTMRLGARRTVLQTVDCIAAKLYQSEQYIDERHRHRWGREGWRLGDGGGFVGTRVTVSLQSTVCSTVRRASRMLSVNPAIDNHAPAPAHPYLTRSSPSPPPPPGTRSTRSWWTSLRRQACGLWARTTPGRAWRLWSWRGTASLWPRRCVGQAELEASRGQHGVW